MRGLSIFRRRFTVRRFSKDEISEGYSHAEYEDIEATLNVQPLSTYELQALPEGERHVRRLKAYGDMIFTPSDPNSGRRGDMLRYGGRWYECVSSLRWDHTILSHCKSEFVEVSEAVPREEVAEDLEENGECGCRWM